MAEDDDSSDTSSQSSTSSEEEPEDLRGPPPQPPKPPLRPINFFIKDKFAQTKREIGPYRRPSDVFRVLSEKWMQLKIRERQMFEIRALRDALRYREEKDAYDRAYAEWSGKNEHPPLRKRKRKPDAPPRPKSAYKFFVREKWDQVQRQLKKGSDLNKETWAGLRRRWIKLSEQGRQKYEKMNMADIKRYRKARKAVERSRKMKRAAYLRELGLLPEETEGQEQSVKKEPEKEPDPERRNRCGIQ